jgi:PAS domain S-box-containing protein
MCILDDKGIFMAINQHWVEKAGYTKEEAERKIHFSQLIHPDDVKSVRTYFDARACPDKSAPAHYEVRVVGKSGNIMDTVINTRMLPESKLRVVSILDITDLKESEDRYKALVELGVESGECILALQDIDNQEGIITFTSENFLHRTQYTQEEVIGKPFFSFLAETDRAEALSRHRGKMEGRKLAGLYEMSVICKNGCPFPVELTSTITQYKGKPANVVYLRDISEKKAERNETA